MKTFMRCTMKLTPIAKTEIDMAKYSAQTHVRRTFTSTLNYRNIAIMTDADVDGRRKPTII
ncbi:DNA topoisomerase II large subunit [Acinetobacter phage Abraxas]|uniref:DNA topoisomerase II large subunit n=1 Tax=Acinetobacter phage Abraxas TaxID=2736222 RepID=A0A6M9Z5N8_9CAUD|nr:DNA topoisomerase II large subunit [Acinetobacter phage Abraxas]